jgi:hypothetical protein
MQYADNYCSYKEIYEPEHGYIFTGIAQINGYDKQKHSVFVKAENLFKYRQGAYIQEAFPDLTPQDREFLMSGNMWRRED